MAGLLLGQGCSAGRAHGTPDGAEDAAQVYAAPLAETLVVAAAALSEKGLVVQRLSPTELVAARPKGAPADGPARYYVQGADLGEARSSIRIFEARALRAGARPGAALGAGTPFDGFAATLDDRDLQRAMTSTGDKGTDREAAGMTCRTVMPELNAAARKLAAADAAMGTTPQGRAALQLEGAHRARALEGRVTELLETVPSLELVAAQPVPPEQLQAAGALQALRTQAPRCDDGALPGADAVVVRGATLLVSDPLGTREVPAAVGKLVCAGARAGVPVALALSVPATEQPHLDAYVVSAGTPEDVARLLSAGVFWRRQQQDGRSSAALLELVEGARALRAAGHDVRVVAFDAEGTRGSAREALMAARLVAARHAQPDAALVALAGDVHLRAMEGAPWDAGFLPMALRLERAGVKATRLHAAFRRGLHYACHFTPDERMACRVHGRSPTAATLHPESEPTGVHLLAQADPDGFHGRLNVGALSASLPAVRVAQAPAEPSQAQR